MSNSQEPSRGLRKYEAFEYSVTQLAAKYQEAVSTQLPVETIDEMLNMSGLVPTSGDYVQKMMHLVFERTVLELSGRHSATRTKICRTVAMGGLRSAGGRSGLQSTGADPNSDLKNDVTEVVVCDYPNDLNYLESIGVFGISSDSTCVTNFELLLPLLWISNRTRIIVVDTGRGNLAAVAERVSRTLLRRLDVVKIQHPYRTLSDWCKPPSSARRSTSLHQRRRHFYRRVRLHSIAIDPPDTVAAPLPPDQSAWINEELSNIERTIRESRTPIKARDIVGEGDLGIGLFLFLSCLLRQGIITREWKPSIGTEDGNWFYSFAARASNSRTV